MVVLKEKHILYSLITLLLLVAVTLVVVGWAMGYRPNWKEKALDTTGMIALKSLPTSAKFYLDDDFRIVSDGSVSGITPGKHFSSLVKDGYLPWEKEIEVFAQMVTEVNALLIPVSTRIEPLTNTGVRFPILSPSRGQILFFTKNGSQPGIWSIPLSDQPFLNIFKTNARLLAQDTTKVVFSAGEELYWSPAEDEILIKMNSSGYFLLDPRSGDFSDTKDPSLILTRWEEARLKKRSEFVKDYLVPNHLSSIALAPETLWSPNEQLILYSKIDGDYIEYRVANFATLLPVGEEREYVSLRLKKDSNLTVTWYSDNRHLILASHNEDSNVGTVEIIDIDGANRREVYSGSLYSPNVFSNPSGDRLIILASFKNNVLPDLYTISLR